MTSPARFVENDCICDTMGMIPSVTVSVVNGKSEITTLSYLSKLCALSDAPVGRPNPLDWVQYDTRSKKKCVENRFLWAISFI